MSRERCSSEWSARRAPDGEIPKRRDAVGDCARQAARFAARHHRRVIDPAPPLRQRLGLYPSRRAAYPGCTGRAAARSPGRAAGLRGRVLRGGSGRPSPGHRARRRRAPAIPISPGVGPSARAAQSPPALADALPQVRRSVGQHLASDAPTRQFASAAVIELVARSAIRAGSEDYTRLNGTRGAATLLKSNVTTYGESITLRFRSKGGKIVTKEFTAPRLVRAIALLRPQPGRRLFQYRAEDGTVRGVTTREVNAFLREIAGANISLKDFRTLLASASVLEMLARTKPAANERQRRKQVLEAVSAAAEDLANTPTICRKSYVHDTVVTAFEDGVLERFAQTLKNCRSPTRRAKVLARIIAAAGSPGPR